MNALQATRTPKTDAAEHAGPVFSVVVPAFNEEAVLPVFHARLRAAMEPLGSWEVIYIDDGSTDGTRVAIDAIRAADPHAGIVALSRNFGKEIATTVNPKLKCPLVPQH